MSGWRLVLISRRFWPLVGGAEVMMANLAAGFQAAGHQVTLLTARWHPSWPAEIQHRGVRVVRLSQPALRMWGTWKYMRGVSQWLHSQRGKFDLVYVSMLKHGAYAALGEARRGKFPVVLRAEGAGLSGDCQWQLDARGGRWIKRRCFQAASLVAPSAAIQRELIAAGYPRDRIQPVFNGVEIPPPHPPDPRPHARARPRPIHPIMSLSPETPLVVYTGRLHRDKGLEHLLRAWSAVQQQHPLARLWLVGEGPDRHRLQDLVEALGLLACVTLTGAFDNIDEVLQAADAFVLPSLEEGMSLSLLEAMAAGLPVVATDIPGNRQLITPGQHGLLVPAENPVALADSLNQLLSNPSLSASLGTSARQLITASYSLPHSIQSHLDLFSQLLAH